MGSNPTTSLEIVNKKKYYSWILYDWANSAYATVVLAGFFPIIFADYYATEFLETTRTLLLGIANSTASLLLIIFAPFLGLVADRRNNRKLFLIIFALLGIFSTLFLAFVGKDNWALASMFFSISLLGFMLSNVFYDSMLLNFSDKSSYKKKYFPHTLNGSALAIGRTLAALIENHTKDNIIHIPDVLRVYTGFDSIKL